MAFQSAPLQMQQASGVQGDRYDDSPWRSEPFTLNSALASYNVIGATAVSLNSDGTAGAGNAGSEVFLGYLCNSKEHASLGSSSDPFAPTMTLPNQTICDVVNMGCLWVTLPATAAIGDLVVYDGTTGALSTIAPGADLPVGKFPGYAVVDRFAESGGGLAVIRITVTPEIPVLASPDLVARNKVAVNSKTGVKASEETGDKEPEVTDPQVPPAPPPAPAPARAGNGNRTNTGAR